MSAILTTIGPSPGGRVPPTEIRETDIMAFHPNIRRTASLLAATTSASGLASGGAPAQGMNSTDLGHEVVIDGLGIPWDLAFLDDGTMFFTEICNGLSVRLPDGTVNALLGMGTTQEGDDHATVSDDLICNGQAGMNGVAVDPDFAENRRIYVHSASEMSESQTNRVLRFVVNENFTGLSERADLIEDIPYKTEPTDHPFGNAGAHNGGRIRFGPEGYLWVTTGDNHNASIPQDPQSPGSSVLRITTEGEPAPENGVGAEFDQRIYT
jgi:glucose/arabinose dehydrogenase